MMRVRDYQNEMSEALTQRFHNCPMQNIPVKQEWRSIANIKGLYCPKIDIAVGPFAAGRTYEGEYDMLLQHSHPMVEQLIAFTRENFQEYYSIDDPDVLPYPHISEIRLRDFNRNARCFLAVEIENKVSRKHLLGGAVNASALGRIGVVIGWTDDKVRALVRLLAYWQFLHSVGKNTYRTDNLFIVSLEQFRQAVESL